MKWEENLKSGSFLRFYDSTNRDLGERMVLAHPPEPPAGILMNDPLNSIYIGRTKMMHVPFYWSFEKLTNPHIAIVGVTGAGKSYLVKTFLTRAAIVWKTNALILDWAGEYIDWVEQTGGQIIELGGNNFLNLLDLGGNSPLNRIRQIMRSFEILFETKGREDEQRVLEASLEEAYLKKGFSLNTKNQNLEPPTLKDVHEILLAKAETAESVWIKEYILNAANMIGRFTKPGMDFFARQSTLELGKLTSSGLVNIVLKKLPDEDFRILAALSILQYLKERMREEEWSASKGLKLYVVLDEAWKVAGDDRSDAIMIVREGRKYKFGLIVASQNPTDINEAIFSNVGTTFILNLKFERFKDYVRGSLKYSDYIAESIEKFGVGNAAVNLMYSSKADFPRTFLIDKIHGEDPLEEITIRAPGQDLVLDKSDLRRKLSYEDLDIDPSAILSRSEISSIEFAKLLENHTSRHRTVQFLNYIGFDMEPIRKTFRGVEHES